MHYADRQLIERNRVASEALDNLLRGLTAGVQYDNSRTNKLNEERITVLMKQGLHIDLWLECDAVLTAWRNGNWNAVYTHARSRYL